MVNREKMKEEDRAGKYPYTGFTPPRQLKCHPVVCQGKYNLPKPLG